MLYFFVLHEQILFWFVIPAVKSPNAAHANHTISLMIILQYIPRLFVIFPLNQRIIKTTGVVAKTAWAGAAYNLLLYLLAGHVCTHITTSSWYFILLPPSHILGPSRKFQFCKRTCNYGICIQLIDIISLHFFFDFQNHVYMAICNGYLWKITSFFPLTSENGQHIWDIL